MAETKQETGDTADNNASLIETPKTESKQTKFEGSKMNLTNKDVFGNPILWFHLGADVAKLEIGDRITVKSGKTYRGKVVSVLANQFVAITA